MTHDERPDSAADTGEQRDRLGILAEAAGSLFASLSMADVLPAVGALAERLLPADAYAVWRYDAAAGAAGAWVSLWHKNLSPPFVAAVTEWTASLDSSLLPEPVVVSDSTTAPILEARRAIYVAEGIRSVAIVPLRVHNVTHGTVVAYYRTRKEFTDADRRVATALSNLGSSALATALLYEEQSQSRAAAELAERRAVFLADAGAALASSLNYQDTLKTVSQLAVPEIADWCAVDIVDHRGSLTRLAVSHVDPGKIAFAETLQQQYPPDPAAPHGVHECVRTRTPILIEEISEEMVRAGARDAHHAELILELGLQSYMCVPLVAHGRALGALTFAVAESGRRYTKADLRFADDVASRAALAVENARAYDEVSRANRLKDDFLATLSHELRTPLNAVLGYTRMLRTGALPADKHARALETVERNALSLTQLVEDVLDVSRIEAGKIRLDVQPVSLPRVVEAAIATVKPAADARGVRIQTIVNPLTPHISGDAERLQQIIWNLLSNAVKFTPRGGRVQVRLEQVDSSVEVVVSDTGAGIARDFLPHVFERFRQADSRFSREHGGLGLGLAITRHLVEMHGGTIEAASDGQGTGSTFRIRLPLVIVHGQPVPQGIRAHARSDGADAGALEDLSGVRVLAVDDDLDALVLLREVLETAGAVVTTAGSAAEALEIAEHAAHDVLISDIGMPGMDGFELIRRIRGMSDTTVNRIPAAALTAYARSDDRTRTLQSGFQMHLSKPINPAELAAAVVALAGRRRPQST
jgi:signal transduction histidine kinase/CheY-like chemotaxis protein